MIGRAIELYLFVQARRFPFRAREAASLLGWNVRTLYRYLQVLEGFGIVEHDDERQVWVASASARQKRRRST